MNTNTVIRRFLVVFLTLCLVMPGAGLAGGKGGKKNFKEGLKYEQQQQWDMAAQQFALAVAAEPSNAEYKLHYIQALQRASIMYLKRGDDLAEQGDLAGAFTAYRTAYNYDQGNEIARMKMERMLEQQKAQATGADPININRAANVRPTSSEVQLATKPRSRDVVQTINFKEAKFRTVVANLGKQLGLNVVFDESVKDQPVSIDLTDVTVATALDIIFKTYKYNFEQVDRRTILVYQDNPANRPRFESLLVKTFYLGNITGNQARTALTPMLPPGRQITTLEQGNTQGGNLLLVKATASELQLVQDIINSLDKNKNEVVLDVDIYEVSKDSSLELGNQVITQSLAVTKTGFDSDDRPYTYNTGNSSFLGDLGGIGRQSINPIAGSTASPFLGGVGTLFGLPPTQLKALQSKGDTKLLYKTNIHVLDGQKNVTKVGKSVPVRVGTSYGGGGGIGVGFGQGVNQGGGVNPALTGNVGGVIGGFGYPGIDQIQYRDVGLVVEAKPLITAEGYVEIEIKFETSDVLASGASSDLTPTFTQRSLTTFARIQDGVTAVVAGINQDVKGNSVAGIPFVSMIPILGRLFAAPRQTNSQSDIIITVTPHIVRSQGINQKDYLANYAGQTQAGPTLKVEDVVNRAQQEEEQERRLIAQSVPQTTPLNTPAQATTTQAAGFNQAPRPASPQTIQPVSNAGTPRNQRTFNNQSFDPAANTSVNVPTPAPVQSAPSVPEPQPQIDSQNNEAIPGDQNEANAGNAAANKKDGEKQGEKQTGKQGEEELKTVVTPPEVPFEGTSIMMVKRPENIEKELAKKRAEAERRAKETRAREMAAPVETPQDVANQGAQQKPSPAAVPRMAEPSRNNSPVAFSLSPRPIRQQTGKTFTVAVEVSGKGQMTGANIALRFDPSKLKFKSVKDAGMFGAQPDLTYEVERGNLVVKIKQQQAAPISGSGRLILIEFAAIAEGQSEITFNAGATQIKMANNTLAQAGGSPTQVIISRDGAISATNDK